MLHAVCAVPVAAVRNEPGHKAEMTSQLLFGEYCTVTETTKESFAKITMKADGYEGWCQLQHLAPLEENVFNAVHTKLAAGWVNDVMYNGTLMHIPFGSIVDALPFKREVWDVAKAVPSGDAIRQVAFTFLNSPYLWGGRSVFGIDCSGFAQSVYKFFNIALLRDAHQQATQGDTVDFLQQAQCGDLAFFDNEDGLIVHVGILLSSDEIIHASGKVQVDHIDNGGIVSKQTGQRIHKLRIIKRYF